VEYVRYSAYGESIAYPVADVNMDGSVSTADQTDWNSGTPSGNYALGTDYDLNRDGAVDAADTTFFNASYTANTATGGKGRMSSLSVGNRKGYAGYEFDEAASVYHVRHRVYLPEVGRWTRRDPLGYVDGMGLYEYVGSRVGRNNDPSGLISISCSNAGPNCDIVHAAKPGMMGHEWIELGNGTGVGFYEAGGGCWFTPNPDPSLVRPARSTPPTHCTTKTGDPATGSPATRTPVKRSNCFKVWNPSRSPNGPGYTTLEPKTLGSGNGAGGSCESASCGDIISCLERFLPPRDYTFPFYTCVDAAKDALNSCCLSKS
jgi:RHS repeat-associated protein